MYKIVKVPACVNICGIFLKIKNGYFLSDHDGNICRILDYSNTKVRFYLNRNY